MANGLSKSKLTGAAVAAIAAAYAVAPMTATAKDPIPAQCQGISDELPRLRCARTYWQQRNEKAESNIAAANARKEAAEKEMRAANASSVCIDRVVREAGDPKTLSSDKKAAVRAKILACG